MRIRWPLERTLRVTMHLHSGARLSFTAERFEADVGGHGDVTGLRWTGARGSPLHIDPRRIEAIVIAKAIRRRMGE